MHGVIGMVDERELVCNLDCDSSIGEQYGGSMAFQVTPPEPFAFSPPEEWPKWIRRFEWFRLATRLKTKTGENQMSTFIYWMGDDADDNFHSFRLS